MKIRQGFVSNSSTSSFVAIGFDIPEDIEIKDLLISLGIVKKSEFEEITEDQIDDFCWEVFNDENLIILDESQSRRLKGRRIFGRVLLDVSSNDYEAVETEQDLEDIRKEMNKWKDKLNITSKTKIYSGMREG